MAARTAIATAGEEFRVREPEQGDRGDEGDKRPDQEGLAAGRGLLAVRGFDGGGRSGGGHGLVVVVYRDVAGLPHRFTDAGYAEFGTGSTRLAVYERRRAEWLTGIR